MSEELSQLERMTAEELATIAPGIKLRDIPGTLYHVVVVTGWTRDGKDSIDVATLAYWSRWQCWKFRAVDANEMLALFMLDKPQPCNPTTANEKEV